MNSGAGHSPVGRKAALVPVCLAFLAAPVVWAVLHWILKLPGGSLRQALSASTAAGTGNSNQSSFIEFIGSGGIWWLLLQAVLLYPVLEEIVFRGALQGWLLQRPWLNQWRLNSRFGGLISIPNLLASVAFTALHFINQPPLWAALVFIPSLVFGWAREHSGGVLLPVFLHIWYNAGFYFLFVPL